MVLTARQQEELQLAVHAYLVEAGHAEAAAAMAKSANLGDDAGDAKYTGLLEKKWTTITRLQKRNMELQAEVEELRSSARAPRSRTTTKMEEWVPRPPATVAVDGHRLPITAVAIHPSFAVMASASEDASIKLWDMESGNFERSLKGHTNAVNDIAYDREGNRLVSCSTDMTIKVWNMDNFTCTKTLSGHDHTVSSVRFDHTGDRVFSASRDKTIKIWELATGYCLQTLQGHSDWVRSIDVSADGAWICSASSDHTVRVWSVASGECKHVWSDHEHVVEHASFAPLVAHEALNLMIFGSKPSAEAASKGPFVASASRDKSICLFDVSTGQHLARLTGHDNWVRATAWSRGGRYLFSVADDKTMRVWDIATKRVSKTIPAHNHFVSCIAVHAKNTHVVTGSVDLKVKVWECN
ncbi:uncharacterized protein MONBRDRAFT_35260 [Monosiga brevicollis MX1]|uniref:Lissencephaly-1 homolog n=1 Tax=Monosiga brevicollis TaxID=81824 RepID=LIS1_MONBE|nr:uncharacterized protein MONBRDRAFT_35260 [Monosiga brevicollis MX1]A9V790.1 RecName: Full=Lissencephaly-1 homolog [Monosiga brevicollis]EDQ86544.1 predicted protein [Monosiga brevicollis MX1]|eukprot:XP_001748657.1 hypothetical protein [Monosiga brevicollis MX1]